MNVNDATIKAMGRHRPRHKVKHMRFSVRRAQDVARSRRFFRLTKNMWQTNKKLKMRQKQRKCERGASITHDFPLTLLLLLSRIFITLFSRFPRRVTHPYARAQARCDQSYYERWKSFGVLGARGENRFRLTAFRRQSFRIAIMKKSRMCSPFRLIWSEIIWNGSAINQNKNVVYSSHWISRLTSIRNVKTRSFSMK